jgi:hypothetical protein
MGDTVGQHSHIPQTPKENAFKCCDPKWIKGTFLQHHPNINMCKVHVSMVYSKKYRERCVSNDICVHCLILTNYEYALPPNCQLIVY